MRKVALFSTLLFVGLVGSQLLGLLAPETSAPIATGVRLLTMAALAFIMIHVGYEFEIDKKNLKPYGWDYVVAATAAAFPWIFCALWFVLSSKGLAGLGNFEAWKESLLLGRFAAPTSAGILFSMLAAAGLSATWLFRKARVLAIFDDLDTVLLMIPLKMMMVGPKWQLLVIVAIMAVLLWIAWKWLHAVRIPVTWPWVLSYGAGITAVSEVIYQSSKLIDDVVPIHIEILLPAFVLGCILARPAGHDPHLDDAREGHQEGPEQASEQKASTIISACFMVLVGLSMPPLDLSGTPLPSLIGSVLALTILSNLGKMFPLFCYRKEVPLRTRLALCIGMWPRGEVGAGVLVVSLGYGLQGPMVAAASLSLATTPAPPGISSTWPNPLLPPPPPSTGH